MKIDDLIAEGYDLLNAEKLWPAHDGGMVDRSKYVTSSEVWNCHRRIKYGKEFPRKGFPNWGFAERGHTIEHWAVNLIRAALKNHRGYDLLCAGEQQVTFRDGDQSGTPDGVLRFPDYSVEVWEFKSIDPRTNYSKLPKEAHIWQLQQNMDLVEYCMNVTVRGGRIIYIDASNFQKRPETFFPPNQVIMKEAQTKANLIMNTPAEQLPAEGIYRGECRLCDHKARCSALIQAEQKETAQLKEAERTANGIFK